MEVGLRVSPTTNGPKAKFSIFDRVYASSASSASYARRGYCLGGDVISTVVVAGCGVNHPGISLKGCLSLDVC